MLVDCLVSTETPKASWSDALVGRAAHGTLWQRWGCLSAQQLASLWADHWSLMSS